MSERSSLALKAVTMRGLEEVLAEEIRQLGGKDVRPARGVVLFRGDFLLLYSCCYYLRTAMRVLLELGSTRIGDQSDLYKFGRSLPWRDWFGVQSTMAVEAAVHSRIFPNSHFAAIRLKDAICDEFKARTGKRPDVSVRDADIRIHLHLHEQDCSVSLDAAGGSLHRRGYRVTAEAAPLSEVLAAGMILIANPDWNAPFYDFMCGSGTLPLEAFMIRHKLPPGIFRDMSFEKWKIYFAKEHKKILDQAKGAWKAERKSISEESLESAEASEAWEASETPPSQLREQSEPFASSEGAGEGGTISEEAPGLDGRNAMIRGSDVADRSIQVAKNNRKWLKLSAHQVFFETLDAASISDLPSSGTAIINPPYGERLSLEDAAAFYKELGDIMKRSFKGWSVWVLSSNKEGLKSIGLKAARKHTLFNGPLECSFRRFDMY